MKYTYESLLDELNHAGIVINNHAPQNVIPIPWYIRVLHGAGGWVAACLIFLFLLAALEDVIESVNGSLVIAFACLLATYFLFKTKESDFYTQLALAFSLCGQLIIAFRIVDADFSIVQTCLLIIAFQACLFYLMPNYIHRLLNSLGVCGALLMLSSEYQMFNLIIIAATLGFSVINLKDIIWYKYSSLMHPISHALLVTALCGAVVNAMFVLADTLSLGIEKDYFLSNYLNAWFYESTIAMILLYVCYEIAKSLRVNNKQLGLYLVMAALFSLVTLQVSGFALGLIILLIAYQQGNRMLLTIAIISLLSFISFYYYSLQISLLDKALILVMSGALLIGFRYLLIKYYGGENHA